MSRADAPYPIFTGLDNRLLDNGYVYFGVENDDPETNPIAIFADAAMTIPLEQPLRTKSGLLSGGDGPVNVYVDGPYSMRVRNFAGVQVIYQASVTSLGQLLATPTGSGLIGFIQAAAGAIIRPVLDKLRDQISPFDYMPLARRIAVMAGTNTEDLSDYIQAAANDARTRSRKLDLLGAPAGWGIAKGLDFTGVPVVEADFNSPIVAVSSGSYPKEYAITFGDPAVTGGLGRSNGLSILGCLHVTSTSRSTALHGIFFKGSYHSVDYVFAENFNGSGVVLDSVWDSTYGHIGTDRCGNITTFANVISSNADTSNTTHVVSMQCEQPYHKGIYANLTRYVVSNIHNERTAILTTNEGTPGVYTNHEFFVGNSSIHQAVFDALTSGTAPDGSALAATALRIRLVGDNSSFSEILATGATVYTDYGTNLNLRNVKCANLLQSSPASHTLYEIAEVSGTCSLEQNATIMEASIGTFNPQANAKNLLILRGQISSPLNFTGNILGNIVFDGVTLGTVSDTRSPAAGYLPVQFRSCNINTFSGAFNADAILQGCYIATVSLASQSKADIRDCRVGSFAYTGNTGFLTRGVICTGPASWTTPGNVNYPAGTVTERVGYNAAGKLFQNTDGATTWALLV